MEYQKSMFQPLFLAQGKEHSKEQNKILHHGDVILEREKQ